MSPLSDLVVLAGPNGAGKSRILHFVKEVLSNPMLQEPSFTAVKAALAHHDSGLAVQQQETIDGWRRGVALREAMTVEGEFSSKGVLEFFPRIAELQDYRGLADSARERQAAQVKEPGTAQLEKRALPYLVGIERRCFAATHPASRVDETVKQAAIDDRASLAKLVAQFIGEEPIIDLDQHPTLFGRPIPDAKLSQGQSLLLQMAVALHAQGSQLGGLVLLLDEPECHLHPSAIVEALDRLRSIEGLGQIWLATHSVPLLAALPPEAIWYVNEGGVSWAGRRTEVVLEGLLGGREGRARVEEFLRLPAQFASNRFAAECLIAPVAVNTGPDDPQARQVRGYLERESEHSGSAMRVVDFGAGQGRLLSAMHERWSGSRRFSDAVDYFAFEPFSDGSGQLQRVLSDVYGEQAAGRLFAKSEDFTRIDPGTVDTVVMCNVLHEVEPQEWRHLFGQNGSVTSILRPDGHLLILEDMEIPHGEKAHRFGFLLLDNAHLRVLLKCTEGDPLSIETLGETAERLRVHVVPAGVLGRCDRESTLAALTLLRDTARTHVRRLRTVEPTSREGRLHALWTQLLANCDLGLHFM